MVFIFFLHWISLNLFNHRVMVFVWYFCDEKPFCACCDATVGPFPHRAILVHSWIATWSGTQIDLLCGFYLYMKKVYLRLLWHKNCFGKLFTLDQVESVRSQGDCACLIFLWWKSLLCMLWPDSWSFSAWSNSSTFGSHAFDCKSKWSRKRPLT